MSFFDFIWNYSSGDYNPEIDKDLLNEAAITNMFLTRMSISDGVESDEESEYIQEFLMSKDLYSKEKYNLVVKRASELLDNKNEFDKVIEALDDTKKIKIMTELAQLMAIDANISDEEINYFFEIGETLSLKKELVEKILEAIKSALNKTKQNLNMNENLEQENESLNFNEIQGGNDVFVNWIYGFESVYDYYKSKDHIHLYNTPFYWFEEESDLHSIVVRVENKKIAYNIINNIISLNGGFNSFKSKESVSWDYFFEGDIFSIGYLPENQCVRINKIDQFEFFSEDIATGIYLYDEKLREIVKGAYKIFYYEGEGPSNGRVCVKDNGSNSWCYAFFDDIDESLKYFKHIVKNYDESHKVFNLSNDQLEEKVSNDGISFKNKDFELLLIRENVKYKFYIFPPGGLLGNWSFIDEILDEKDDEFEDDDLASQLAQSYAEDVIRSKKEEMELEKMLREGSEEKNTINFCASCGNKVEIQGNFCTNCGSKLS